jgi:hypothetical protein
MKTFATCLVSATCSPTEVNIAYGKLLASWKEASPGYVMTNVQHSTCSIGSPSSPYVMLSLIIFSEIAGTGKPSDYSTGP